MRLDYNLEWYAYARKLWTYQEGKAFRLVLLKVRSEHTRTVQYIKIFRKIRQKFKF